MAGTAISGYGGTLSLMEKGDQGLGTVGASQIITTLSNWNLSSVKAVQERYASNTGRYAVQLPGVESFSGSYSRYATVPLEKLGKTYKFNGYAGHTQKIGNQQQGLHYRGAVLITGINITYNWETRDANSYTVNFISNWCEEGDELTIVEENALLDIPSSSNPHAFRQPAQGGIQFAPVNPDGTYNIGGIKPLCVKNCTLNFNINPIIENNSCSGQYQHCLEGGNIQCGINCTVSSSSFDDVAAVGENLLLRIYPSQCEPGLFWEFYAITNVSLSNLNVDPEGGSAVNFTMQGQFNKFGHLCSAMDGYILDPLGNYWAEPLAMQ